MTLLDARGPIAISEKTFANCLLASPEFLSFTKESDTATAANHIYFNVVDKDPDTEFFTTQQIKAVRPFVCLWADPENGLEIFRSGTNVPACSGILQAYFEKEVSDAKVAEPTIDESIPGEVFRFWTNMIGRLAFESFNDSIMHVNRIFEFNTWQLKPEKKHSGLGEFFGAHFKISWGVGNG